jgi:5'-3' exonuclease
VNERSDLYLVDGTYELFRAYFAVPSSKSSGGGEVGATKGLLRTLYALLRAPGVTHVACAFDHVIESFRNRLFDGYKTGEGLPVELTSQFELAERASRALGIVTWPMVEFEADDALATAALRHADDPRLGRVLLCTPDKDLAQCVRGDRVLLFDRQRKIMLDEPGVMAKFGVPPDAIPDYLALVGDTADGIPGVPRWGARSAAQLLAHYGRLDRIPLDAASWAVKVRGAEALARSLAEHLERALLYRTLATLRTDVPLDESLDDLAWRGPRREELAILCAEIGETTLLERLE